MCNLLHHLRPSSYIQITPVVNFSSETEGSVVAALDDMLRNAGEIKAGFSPYLFTSM